jgi:predicted phage tail protein
MKQRVLLLDELGEKFGPVHEYHNLRTPVDAIKLLSLNYPAFAKELIESGEKGVGYKVIQSETEFELEDMLLPFGSKDLIIAPVITGSSSGFGKFLAGAALIGLAIWTGGSSLAFTGAGFGAAAGVQMTTTLALSAMAGNIGIALALGGISQMLSPQPEGPMNIIGSSSQSGDTGPGSSLRGLDGSQSYAYRGPVNTVGAGATIPLVFGECLIGSHTVAAHVEVTDDSDPLSTWIREPNVGTMRVNGEQPKDTFEESNKSGIGVKLKTWTDPIHATKQTIDPNYNDNYKMYLRKSGQTSDAGSTSIPLSKTDSEYDSQGLKWIGEIIGEGPTDDHYDTSRFQMAFLLDNGLADRVGGIGTLTTHIDGFITFQIIIKEKTELTVVGNTQFTVQGMLLKTQHYRWATEFSYAKIEHKDDYFVYAKLIDFGGDANVNTLRIDYMGYNFLGD